MLGPLDYAIWIACTLCEAAVVVCSLRRNAFRRYIFLNMYMAASVLFSIARFRVLQQYGFSSSQYFYFYYYSDAIQTVLLYFALTSLFSKVFDEIRADRYVRYGATLLLLGTALFSYGVIQQASDRLVTRFVVEMSQNLYFVGMVLTYILWGAIMKMRESRTRLIQLVLSLGIYFSLHAADYAFRNLYPTTMTALSHLLPPVIGCFLPMAWAYAFWRLPEEARLATSRLAVIPR